MTLTYSARDYQTEATNAALDGFFAHGKRRQLTVLPTGTGKTVVFAMLRDHPRVREWIDGFARRQQRMLVIAHREELLNQAAEKLAASNPELIVDIEQAERRASAFCDVVVASIQTLVRRLDKFDPCEFRIIIIDEAHHAAAPTYVKVLRHFGVLPDEGEPIELADLDAQKMLLGFTATPKRGDDIGLDAVFECISYSRELKWFIEREYLTPLCGRLVETTVSLDDVKTVQGDFAVKQLAETVNTPQRNDQIVKAWLEHAPDRKTIAFTVDIAHAHDLARTFSDAGVKAAALSGETPKEVRRELLRRFASGELQVLTNCNVLTEGFDEPSVNCIVHARPTKSSLLYIQMTGRGTRPSPQTGKRDCLILDCVDIASRHSLITVADLVGLPPKFDCKGGDIMRTKKDLDELRAANPFLNVIGARSFAEIQVRVRDLDLWKQPEPPPVLQKHAALAWAAGYDGESFALRYPIDEGDRKRTEVLEARQNQLGQWDITLDGVPLDLGALRGADEALSAGERWFQENRRFVMTLVKKDARWRSDPATPNQLKWLTKKHVPHDPATISKGEASRLLDIAFGRK